MNRRQFLKRSAAALAGARVLGAVGAGAGVSPPAGAARKPASKADKMKRVGCTTVCFRARFPQTRPRNAPKHEGELDLLRVPAFFAETLGVHNVELWSLHFAATTPAYCRKLRQAAEKAGSRIINVQLDTGGYNLSHAQAAARKKSVQFVKDWMDRAAACGATSLRANTGGGRGAKFDVKVTGDAFAQLAEHGRKINVRILLENHGGHSSDPDNVVAIVRHVDSPWCRTLPDFGNMPARFTQAQRNAFLGKLLPYAHLISAKGMYFDKHLRHKPYDLGACVRFAESRGFKGVYSAEQWAPKPLPVDDVRATKRIFELILANL